MCIRDRIGTLSYILNGKEIGNVPILASEDVKRANYIDYLKKAAESWLL